MRSRMPQAIWALGLVSLFMDTSSEMIHGLLPIFLVGTLGASAFSLGLIEGVAEAIASILKLPSGWLSDHWRRRKALALAGYGLAALVKPIFALAPTVGWAFTARSLDRLGKGIRGAPRDALVADLVAPELHGTAFGLRQSLDTIGAFAGPLIAVVAMALSGNNIRLVFWLAVQGHILGAVGADVGKAHRVEHACEARARLGINGELDELEAVTDRRGRSSEHARGCGFSRKLFLE